MTDMAAVDTSRRNAVASVTAFLLLGILGGAVVAWAFPALFEINWLCLFDGPASPAAHRYVVVAAIGGVVSWLTAACVALIASSPARPRVGVWVALVWFTLYVAAGFVGAEIIGRQPCTDPGSGGFFY